MLCTGAEEKHTDSVQKMAWIYQAARLISYVGYCLLAATVLGRERQGSYQRGCTGSLFGQHLLVSVLCRQMH